MSGAILMTDKTPYLWRIFLSVIYGEVVLLGAAILDSVKPADVAKFLLFGTPALIVVAIVAGQFIVKPDSETRCRKCGYILRGISEPRCSECGEVI